MLRETTYRCIMESDVGLRTFSVESLRGADCVVGGDR